VQVPVSIVDAATRAARLAPMLRRALATPEDSARGFKRWILDYRATDEALALLGRDDGPALAREHPLTPDHVIRTKGQHLFLADLPEDDDAALATALADAVREFAERYDAYFEANKDRSRTPVTQLDATPRVMLLAATAGALAGGMCVHMHCPITEQAHLLLGHATIGVLLIFASLLVLKVGARTRRTLA